MDLRDYTINTNNDTTPLLSDKAESNVDAGFNFHEDGENRIVSKSSLQNNTKEITESEDEHEIDQGNTTIYNRSKLNEKQETTYFIIILTILSAIGGFLFGYDTGVMSGAMILLQRQFLLTTVWEELIVSITLAAAAVFALLSGFLNERFGRRRVILIASIIFTIGGIILGASVNRAMLLVGRFLVGVGIGLSSMTVPIYIAESAPTHLRGRLCTLNQLAITTGQFVAGLVAGAFSYDLQNGWRYILGLSAVPSLIQICGFLVMPESPRWLLMQGHHDQGRKVLQKIRNSANVDQEMHEIMESCVLAKNLHKEHGGQSVLLRVWTIPSLRRALLLGCSLQLFQQLIGINTVMYYSATIIQMSGVRSPSAAIWLAALTASVNFLFTFVGLWLVERVGRRPLTLVSLAGTAVSLAVLAVSFQLAAAEAPPVTVHELIPSNLTFNGTNCDHFSTCDACMMNKDCGYCYEDSSSGAINGSCLPAAENEFHKPQSNASMYGRCHHGNADSRSTMWAYTFCPTGMAWMATFGLVLYLASFAPGMGPMPWVINSEIYPLWARSTCIALTTGVNWTVNLIISMTFLTLTEVLTRYGAFWLYCGFAVIGLLWFLRVLPETRGHSLEKMEEVFAKPWWPLLST